MSFTKLRKVPEVGTVYNMFDDGKIRRSRLSQCLILELIKFEDAEEDLINMWKVNIEDCP